MTSIVPKPILIEIFSYLEPKDLATVSRVCKKWCQAAAVEELWLRFALKHQEAFPSGLAKSKVRSFTNCSKKRYQHKAYEGREPSSSATEVGEFTITAHGKIFSVYSQGRERKSFYIWEREGESNRTYALQTPEHTLSDWTADSTFTDDLWVRLTSSCNVEGYSLSSGELRWHYNLPPAEKQVVVGQVACDQQLVVVGLNHTITLLDYVKGVELWKAVLDKGAFCSFVGLNKDLVLFVQTWRVLFTHTSDKNISRLEFRSRTGQPTALNTMEFSRRYTLATSENYFALYDSDRELLSFYRWAAGAWIKTGQIDKSDHESFTSDASLCLTSNLLSFCKRDQLALYDLKDGSVKFSIELDAEFKSARTNGSIILTRQLSAPESAAEESAARYLYNIYDFKNAPSPPSQTVKGVATKAPWWGCLLI